MAVKHTNMATQEAADQDPTPLKHLSEDVAIAQSLLLRSPESVADVLSMMNMGTLGVAWMCWLSRAEALSQFAGNTRLKELVIRTVVVGTIAAGIGYGVGGARGALAGAMIIIPTVAWWALRRTAWRRACARHIIWGALLLDEHRHRFKTAPQPRSDEALEKIQRNVGRFASNFADWTGQSIARRVG